MAGSLQRYINGFGIIILPRIVQTFKVSITKREGAEHHTEVHGKAAAKKPPASNRIKEQNKDGMALYDVNLQRPSHLDNPSLSGITKSNMKCLDVDGS